MPRRKCRGCGEYKIAKDADKRLRVCSDACRDKVIAEAIAKVRKQREQQAKKVQRLDRQKVVRQKREHYAKDVPHQLKRTQTLANRLVRLLDAGKPCISCGRPDEGGRKRNASHLKSRGANSALRFCLVNLHDACVTCNNYQSGNIGGYRQGLVERCGQAALDYLDTAPRLKKWAVDELAALQKEFGDEIRRLERGLPPSRDWRAVPVIQLAELGQERAA